MSNVEINLSYTDSNGNLDASTLTAVNALIGQGGGGSGLAGITIASAHGMAGNGTTDDGPALSTLANTTLSGSGTIYLDPGKVFRIATPITIPAGVTLWAPQGGGTVPLKPDGVVLTIQGPIVAGLYPIFNCINGGVVQFSPTTDAAANARVIAVPELYPEWWGAKGDGSNDDTAAINAALAATAGAPTTTTSTVRFAGPPVRLSAGVYKATQPIKVTDVVGWRLVGSGMGNTTIRFTAGETGTATSGTSTTLVNSGKSWTVNQWASGDWMVYIHTGTGAGQWRLISANDATSLTVSSAWTVTPDNTSQYAIAVKAVIDCDGAFTGEASSLYVNVTGYARHGIRYIRDSSVSIRGSSQGRFTNVRVDGNYVDSGWQFGDVDKTSPAGFQADLCTLIGCQAFGQQLTTGATAQQVGYRFGDNAFANALNYTALGCESVGNRYGVSVNATNMIWHGGTIQTSWGADILLNNGLQGYAEFVGFRSEGSAMLLDSTSSQSVTWSFKLSDVQFQADAFTGNRLISWRFGSGSLLLENIRVAPAPITGTASSGSSTTLVDSTKVFPTATVTYIDGQTAVGMAGWDLQIVAGTGNGQRRQITSNTATTLTVPAWTVTPDATSQYQIMQRTPVVIENVSPTHVGMSGCLFPGTPLEQFVQTGPLGGSWDAELHGCAEIDVNASTVFGSTAPYAGSLYFTSGNRPASVGFGKAATVPDARLHRSGVGQIGIPSLRATTMRVQAIGTTPTGLATTGFSGTATYNYKLVASDGTNKALPSASFSTTTGPTVLSPSASVIISLTSGAPQTTETPATVYDILKDDGTGTFKLLAGAVPWYLFQGGFKDVGQPLTAYTAPGSDATGSLTVDGPVSIPDGSISERAVAPNVWPSAVNSGTTQTATWTQVNQKFLYTATGNCTYTIAGIPNGGSMLVVIGTGAGSFTATFAAGAGLGSLRWDGGSAPVLTTTASKYDTFLFEYNGVYLAGRIVGQAA